MYPSNRDDPLFCHLNKLTRLYGIELRQSNLVEHGLLKLAGLTVMPEDCKFGSGLEDDYYFLFRGLTTEAAQMVLDFLRKQCDPHAQCVTSLLTESTSHCFFIKRAAAQLYFVPLFEKFFAQLTLQEKQEYCEATARSYFVGRMFQPVKGLKQAENSEKINNRCPC